MGKLSLVLINKGQYKEAEGYLAKTLEILSNKFNN